MFKPYYDKIHIKPFKRESIIHSEDKELIEKGEVVAVGENVKFVKPGDTIYFDSWGCYKTPDGDYIVQELPAIILGKDDGKE